MSQNKQHHKIQQENKFGNIVPKMSHNIFLVSRGFRHPEHTRVEKNIYRDFHNFEFILEFKTAYSLTIFLRFSGRNKLQSIV